MAHPNVLRLRFNRPHEELRVYLYDVDDALVASFDDLGEAHRWLRERHYLHSPINGGLWVKQL